MPNQGRNYLFCVVPADRIMSKIQPCVGNQNRANKSYLSMENRNPICMYPIVKEKGNLIFIRESLIRPCVGNPNRIATMTQRGNRARRENSRNKLLFDSGEIQNGNNPRGNTRNIGTHQKGESAFFLSNFACILSFFLANTSFLIMGHS